MELLNTTSIHATHAQNSSSSDRSMGTDSFRYPEEYRLEVLARAIDGYVRQLNTGLIQGDFAEQNVMLVANDDAQPEMVA
ncbi:hypothetical protein VP1G_11249 [Cytospora mali]|uniref:Uncharacterized protein n=1 Tax=Cytospora mali TaxID=578113 RepID=A0A194VBT8_CYTMA|nr:hypothetical protein VP1G_11249 [Valsa mali var. pyri (nom. inval.)]